MTKQDELINLVKIKGIGKTMSKSLSTDQLKQCSQLLADPTTHLATKTTLLVAFLMLTNTPEEQQWLDTLTLNYSQSLPKECFFLFDKTYSDSYSKLVECTHRVISKKNLDENELKLSCESIFNPNIPTYFKSALLEALRLKEESAQENAYFCNYFYNKTPHIKINRPILIDLASAYDGFNRYPNILLSLAVLLGSIGFPTIIHGCKDVSPKFGHTLNKLLSLGGKNPYYSIDEVQYKLEDPAVSWAYIDQSLSFPEFHDLVECRTDLVKRPILATIEKFMQPFYADSTFIISGYTHPPYRQKTIELLKLLPHCTDFLFVRGIEGSAVAPIDRRCPVIYTKQNQNDLIEDFCSPEDYNFEKNKMIVANKQLSHNESLDFCIKGLKDSQSDSGKWLTYSALIILDKLNLITDINKTKKQIEHAIESKQCLSHWDKY